MLKNYLKITFRSLLKFKTYLLVNVLGLSLGLACTIMALILVMDEYSFDDFHSKADNIYRINKFYTNDAGVVSKTAESSGLMGPQMLTDFPEVKAFVRFQPWYDEQVITYNEINIKEEFIALADSNFFEVFDFELLEGNPKSLLAQTKSIVLTRSLADKIFGNKNPMGELVEIFGLKFMVTGIAADVPRNSHIQFQALISWSSTLSGDGNLNFGFLNNWISQTMNTYVEMEQGFDIATVEAKMADMLATHLPERKDDYRLYLQHFPDVYLGSDDIQFGNFNLRIGSQSFVIIFNFVAVFVLLIAAVNYINISTSKAMRRALEVGVRKVLGANRGQLFVQFVGEALMITFISGLLAILIVDLSIPYFNEIAGKHLTNSLLFQSDIILSILGIIGATSLISGAYPALLLSSFKPATVLKAGKGSVFQGGTLRKGMIVFQFFLATLMITAAIVVYDQNNFLINLDVGLDSEQVVVVELKNQASQKAEIIQQELEKHPDILNTSVCPATIGGGTYGTTVIPEEFSDPIDIRYFRVDNDFIDVYGIEMAQGRAFDENLTIDRNAVIINESMAKFLGWENAVGKTVQFGENRPEIPVIGVTKDFNYFGPNRNSIDPMVMVIDETASSLAVRVSGNNVSEVIAHIDKTYSSVEDKYPFEYYFVNEWFARQYEAEQKFLTIVTIFSLLSIIISCMGLYGLVSYFIELRVKEIGIRKVLGASVGGIALMINQHFIKLILISLLVSIPVSFWLMTSWLDDFAYRINLGVLPFVLSALLITFIALLTTNNQAIKASRRNPIKSLRYE